METLLPGLFSSPNIHPMLVHFPIALWLTALLFWGLAVMRGADGLFKVGRWLLYLGTLGAVATVFSGYQATSAMGHDAPGHELVHTHRDFMIVASVLAAVTAIAAFFWRAKATRGVRSAQLGLLLITVAVTTLGADRGALLVFRYGIGTKGETPPAAEQEQDHDHDRDQPQQRKDED